MEDLYVSVFWDITGCSQVKVNRIFGQIYRLHFQGSRRSQARNQHEVAASSEHDMSEKIEILLTTGVRTSNPKTRSLVLILASFVYTYIYQPDPYSFHLFSMDNTALRKSTKKLGVVHIQ
jgi:hypothetical protein